MYKARIFFLENQSCRSRRRDIIALPIPQATNPLGTAFSTLTNIWPVLLILVGVILLLFVLRLWASEAKPARKTRRRRRSQPKQPEKKLHPFEKPQSRKAEPVVDTQPEYVSNRELYPWEKLTRRQMTRILAEAQQNEQDEVTCAGCGVSMEIEFMEMDHINPKSSSGPDTIDNRILLCRPCNRIKGQRFTLPGLWQENVRRKRMRDLDITQKAKDNAWIASQKAKES